MSDKLSKALAVAGISILALEEMCFADSITAEEKSIFPLSEDNIISKNLVSPLFLQDMNLENFELKDHPNVACANLACFMDGACANGACAIVGVCANGACANAGCKK
jgi:hypothetical protein